MARTMPDEQEREIRVYCEAANPAYIGKKLLAELDAERAAHEETKQGLDAVVEANLSVRVCRDHTSDVIGEGCLVCELAALKSRLALAEAAILEHFGDTPHGFYECEHGAKATEPCEEAGETCSLHAIRTVLAWREAQGRDGK